VCLCVCPCVRVCVCVCECLRVRVNEKVGVIRMSDNCEEMKCCAVMTLIGLDMDEVRL
jgi:hypothetical protein